MSQSTREMELIRYGGDDAALALALDDALLHRGGFYISTRVNSPCVSIGLNQDAAVEVNLAAAERLGIPVIRRKTGGGAVYRDSGCIAFSFIVPSEWRCEVVGTVVRALAMLGIEVDRTGRNDLFWKKRKVSGLAWSEFENRVLMHGAILFSTDIETMSFPLDKTSWLGLDLAVPFGQVRALLMRLSNCSRACMEESWKNWAGGSLRGERCARRP